MKAVEAYEDPYDCIEGTGFKTSINVKRSDSIYGDSVYKKNKSHMDLIEKKVARRFIKIVHEPNLPSNQFVSAKDLSSKNIKRNTQSVNMLSRGIPQKPIERIRSM